MSKFSIEEIRKKRQEERARRMPQVPVETVGRILASCLSSLSDNKGSFSRNELEQFILTTLNNRDNMPLAIKDSFHVDYTECGAGLHEIDLMVDGILITNYYWYEDGKFYPKEPIVIEMVRSKYEEEYPDIVSWILSDKNYVKEENRMDTSYLENSVASITQEIESCAGAVCFSLERKPDSENEYQIYLITRCISGPSYVYDKYPISKTFLTKLNKLLLDYKIANPEGNTLISSMDNRK